MTVKLLLPSIITILGIAFSCLGLVFWPLWQAKLFFVLSLLFDILDGYVARKLDASTDFGAALDMTTDSVLAVATACLCFPIFVSINLILLLIALQTYGRYRQEKISGRFFIYSILILCR